MLGDKSVETRIEQGKRDRKRRVGPEESGSPCNFS